MIESKVHLFPCKQVIVDRAARQRSSIDHDKVLELAESIAKRDLIHPILISASGTLIAGENRLLAFEYNQTHRIPCSNPDYQNWTHIPVHYAQDVTEQEIHILELEENIKRVALHWRDEIKAIFRYHSAKATTEEAWSANKTAIALGLDHHHVSRALSVYPELDSPKLAQASSVRSAALVVERQNQRAINAEVDELLQEIKAPEPQAEPSAPAPTVFPDSVLVADFKAWWPTYSGPKFNFIHCDFPYGIGYNKGTQANDLQFARYDDSPEVYWELIAALGEALPHIASASCHLMFWFSMNHYQETLGRLRQMGFDVNPFPLIWHKTDNKGILPDPERGPRRVYETAFLCSLGDRKIVRAVSNTYGCPTSKLIHSSEKPESMLRHFFQMFVDEYTVLLDPTCGSGSALRAAEALGAKQVLGLEINPESAELADIELNRARRFRELSA